ncbi:MAG: signal peptide peptidase SppA [Patescibacteria group bacterium]|jgi:signal peptide peptidase SppA|nr:signal peptide peptidase SppA [Patescibacteria group bacterium]
MIENKKNISFKLWDGNHDLKILKIITIFLIITASFITIKNEFAWQFGNHSFNEEKINEYQANEYIEEESCNVYGIELRGELITYIPPYNFDEDGSPLEDQTASENIVYWITDADKDDNIKAILIEIDSYGGYPVAAEEVAEALKKAKKPTVVLIRESGVSAAYWAATGADIIFASENSDIGGIGVTMSYVDNVRQNQSEGLTYNQISFGKFKDTGNPNKSLSNEEKELLARDTEIIYNNFIKTVSENRKLDIEKVKKLADGSSMLGQMALEKGLIDKIGDLAETKEYLKEIIKEEVRICW